MTPRRQLALGVALWLALFVAAMLTVGGCAPARALRRACPCAPSRGEATPTVEPEIDWRARR